MLFSANGIYEPLLPRRRFPDRRCIIGIAAMVISCAENAVHLARVSNATSSPSGIETKAAHA